MSRFSQQLFVADATYKTLFVKACTIVGVTFLLTVNDSKIEILIKSFINSFGLKVILTHLLALCRNNFLVNR